MGGRTDWHGTSGSGDILLQIIFIQVLLRPRAVGPAPDQWFGQLLAIGTVANHQPHSLFDSDPMILVRDRRGGLVDARMMLLMRGPRNLILLLRVGDDLLVFEHETVIVQQLVVNGGAAQATLFGAIRAIGVFTVLEVEFDLVEALLGDKVFPVGTQISAVDDCIYQFVRIRFEIAAALDASNLLEAQRIPDATRCNIGFVHQVENRICVPLFPCESIISNCRSYRA